MACTGQLGVQHTVVDVARQASLSSISKGGTLGRGSAPGAAPGASGMPGIGMGMPGWAAGLAGSAGCAAGLAGSAGWAAGLAGSAGWAAGLAGSAGCAAGLAGSAPGIISSVTGAWTIGLQHCSASRARGSLQRTVPARHALQCKQGTEQPAVHCAS